MKLTIESGELTVERLNNPNDFYLYFSGGFFVWNYLRSEKLYINYKENLFLLVPCAEHSVEALHQQLNDWLHKFKMQQLMTESTS